MEQLSPLQERIRDLLEEVFIEAWGKTTPVRFFYKEMTYPRAPWVQLSISFSSPLNKVDDGKLCRFGILGFGVIFPANTGMEEGLGLAGRVAEIFNFKRFQKDALVVNCKEAKIGGCGKVEGRYCYLSISVVFSAEENSQ